MPFCRFCGKQLADGETCTCEQAQAEANKAVETVAAATETAAEKTAEAAATGAAAAAGAATAAGAQAADALKDAAKVGSEVAGKAGVTCLEILKKPVTEGTTFISGTNYITGIAIVVLQSLLTAVFSLILGLKYNGLVGDGGGWFDTSSLKVNPIKVFFVAILFSRVATLLFAALTFLLLKILKLEVNIYEVVELAGARASIISGGVALAAVVNIIYPTGGICLFVLSGLFAFILVYAILNKKYADSENKLLYGTIALAFVFVVCAAFLFSKTCTWFMPKGFGSISSLLGGGYGNLF